MKVSDVCRLVSVAALSIVLSSYSVSAVAQTARLNLQSLDERVLGVGLPDRLSTAVEPPVTRGLSRRSSLFAAPLVQKFAAQDEEIKPQFSIGAQIGSDFTSNAYNSGVQRRSDHIFSPAVNGGVSLAFGDTTLKAGVGIAGERYARHEDLNNDFAFASLGVVQKFGNWSAAVGYKPLVAYDAGMNDWQATLHVFSIDLSRAYDISSIVPKSKVTPSFSVSRVQGNPSDFNSTKASISAEFGHSLSETVNLILTAEGVLQRYERFFGSDRNDATVSAGIGLAWAPQPWLQVAGAVGALRSWSNLSSKRYSRFDATPSISLAARF